MARKIIFLFFLLLPFLTPSYSSAAAFGTDLGDFNGVTAYSNGSTSYYSGQQNYYNGSYTGIKWQCVEYVRRYYLSWYGINLYNGSGMNANEFYSRASEMGLDSYPNGGTTAPQVGDILVSNGGSYGHVAIVRSVSGNQVCTIQQNFSNDSGDVNRCLALTESNGSFSVSGSSGSYPVQGWLRAGGSLPITGLRVGLLVRNAASVDADEGNIQQFLNSNFFEYDIVDASMIKNGTVDLSIYNVLYMRTASEPTLYNDAYVISRVKTWIEHGGKLIIEYNGVYLAQYLGAGSISGSCWGPAVIDASFYVENITTSPLFTNIDTWSPPSLPDDDNQLIAKLASTGGYCYPVLDFASESTLVLFKFLYTTYGWYGQSTTSDYCMQHTGLCTPDRSVYDESNMSWFWPNGVDDRQIEIARVGNGVIVRLGMILLQMVPANSLIVGPATDQIRNNAIRFDLLSGSFGTLDHFDITAPDGSSIGEQTVNGQFPIKITARDANGSIVNYNGEVSLWSNAGKVKPTTISLTNGTWSDNVKLYEKGTGINIGASGGGKSGTSNDFQVTGSGSGLGRIFGNVDDNRGNSLAGAIVYLQDYNRNNTYSRTTDAWGHYEYGKTIPCGYYFLRAEHNGKSSDEIKIFIPEDKALYLWPIKIPIHVDDAHDPVILIPGIAGSSKKSSTNVFPRLPKQYPTEIDKLEIHDPGGWLGPGWESLVSELQNIGYEDGDTIIQCPFDWRMPVEDVAKTYLRDCINKGKQKTGKVNIIAHSTGGLAVRAYIQSNSYSNDINKFAMVGVPNQGSAKAYYMWEGGDPVIVDTMEGVAAFYTKTTEKLYETMTGKRFSIDMNKKIINKFYHEHVPELGDLLYSEDFLITKDSPYPLKVTSSDRNTFLELLNADPNKYRMGNGTASVDTAVFVGTGQKTMNDIRVQSPNNLYLDGVPEKRSDSQPVYLKNGDTTVLESSALFPYYDGWARPPISKAGGHMQLIYKFRDELIQFLEGTLPVQNSVVASKSISNIQQMSASVSSNTLILSIDGNVQPYIINPDSQAIGINPNTGDGENDIPGSEISFVADSASIVIRNPVNGSYTVYIKGTKNEDYDLSVEYMYDTDTASHDYRGFNHANTTSLTFDINSSSVEQITVNHAPLPTTGLQADAVDSGGLMTRLTWNASIDPEVTGYNIYSKEIGEPYLTQIGTSTLNTFDTGHRWAANSSIKTRTYAVSAVKADNTESFLSNMVENNDRDHDGLSDEEEINYGTYINNSDTDGDGLNDSEELNRGTNALLTDTDGDGLSDFVESQNGTDPLNSDTDGDGTNDLSDTCPTIPPANILDEVPFYYTSLQAAYDSALDGDTIQCQDLLIYGNLLLDINKSVTLQCGYNCDYTAITGNTKIHGDMIVSDGLVTIENVTLMPPDTIPPGPPSEIDGAVISSDQIDLWWTAPATNADGSPLTDFSGYFIYYGYSSGYYTTYIDAGNVTYFPVTGLTSGVNYYFSVDAYDISENHSNYGSEVNFTTP
ncbi:MAG: CHAP domain-containing protein [Nitrospiraceae bacterium]|nr:MAG: CHAP domain-containing protein [Nitrospiraceae bacterium]